MIIGSGSSGKVYKPYPIDCKNIGFLQPKDNYVGKISNTDNLSLEQVNEIEKIRKKIDPKSKFTLPYLGCCHRCTINEDNEVWENGTYDIQYIYSYGGERIKHTGEEISLKKLFRFAKQISKMNQLGYSHLDIKEANVLIKEAKLFLIDFDLCIPSEEIYQKFFTEKMFENIYYYIWPPEINFGLNKCGKYMKSLEKVPLEFEYMWTTGVFSESRVLKRINRYLGSKDYHQLLLKVKQDYAKVDIYSFGMLMKFLLIKPSKEIKALIHKAIEPIPSLRIDWETFLSEFSLILSKLDKNNHSVDVASNVPPSCDNK